VRGWRRSFLVLAALILVAAIVGVQLLVPAPPKRVRIAAGAEGGMYMDAARRYREILARDGVELIVVATSGSMENIGLLSGRRRRVADIAFIQGGTVASDTPDVEALGSVFLEPLWIFARTEVQTGRLAELRGRRIAVGVPGSGTRVLVRQLLEASGLEAGPDMLDLGGQDAVKALLDHTVDVACFVTAKPLPLLDPLLRAPGVRLLSLSQAEAFTRHYPFLSKVVLPAGALDLAVGIPPRDVTMLAPAASLVASSALHPAIVDIVLEAATKIHGPPQLFTAAGQFPSPHYVDLPLSTDAQRWFRSGPTFLRRNLPFWAATVVERLLIFLPLMGVTIPVLTLALGSFQARYERRIHRAYARLRALEEQARSPAGPEDRARLLERLDDLDTEVSSLKLPANQVSQLYHLRTHIEFIRKGLRDGEGAEPHVRSGARLRS
jgi:TRAP transporter TAXI family solute receptor